MTNKQTQIIIDSLLESAIEERTSLTQYHKELNYKMLAHYNTRLEVIVEMIETLDCGSIGGYGKGQPRSNRLYQRLNWLIDKYSDYEKYTF